ncbi:hypothetical protein CPB84DRAFT_1829525 [Gymnopilus junonius]|uniref:Uncharacterized protein n=1 Tax=Gymnopilus junonius TaxID=109634 RepID=A0A9P5N968_GYMJU|nr:hypothetical protein CPB84DRAFT_1829525 [Gymnopilus junonius]
MNQLLGGRMTMIERRDIVTKTTGNSDLGKEKSRVLKKYHFLPDFLSYYRILEISRSNSKGQGQLKNVHATAGQSLQAKKWNRTRIVGRGNEHTSKEEHGHSQADVGKATSMVSKRLRRVDIASKHIGFAIPVRVDAEISTNRVNTRGT